MTSTNNFSNLVNTAYDAQENLELLKGTTKADLFQENLDLKKALNFMKNTLEEKQSKHHNYLMLTPFRPDSSTRRRKIRSKTPDPNSEDTVHEFGEEVLDTQE